LEIFNILGEKIDTVLSALQAAGVHRIRWRAHDLPAGIYFARLQINAQNTVQSLVLLK
jgi:hypothetical protein